MLLWLVPAAKRAQIVCSRLTGDELNGGGNALIGDFVNVPKACGSDRTSLATIDGPEGAGPFHARQGWQLQARRTIFDGR